MQTKIGEFEINVKHSRIRNSMCLTVERDGSISLALPLDATHQEVEQFVKSKTFWLYTKLAEKEELRQKTIPRKQFVAGEGFLYLGRSYRLKIEKNIELPIQLKKGRLVLSSDKVDEAQSYLISWYKKKAEKWIEARFEDFKSQIVVQPEKIHIRDLGYRWGSCSRNKYLYFHWKIILLPKSLIDYVLVHELIHLIEPEHNDAFWKLVALIMPDYEERKIQLDKIGAETDYLF
ncbi:M48 family metallopeptidase [Acinetobacter sp. ANC 4636]